MCGDVEGEPRKVDEGGKASWGYNPGEGLNMDVREESLSVL
jgi:hypothetical protein